MSYIKTASEAYHALLAFTGRAEKSTPAQDALLRLAARMAEHPLLEPYRANPMLTLDGQFPSVDVYRDAIADFRSGTRWNEEGGRVGIITGALWLPAQSRAQTCRILAARDDAPMSHPLTRWPAPVALFPVSDDVAQSAERALRSAVYLLESCTRIEPLWPVPLYYDLQLTAELTGTETAGDSLGLPLFLVFLSALTDLPLRGDVAATGAVGRYQDEPMRVFAVNNCSDKDAALDSHINSFLIPDGCEAGARAHIVPDLWHAANAALVENPLSLRMAAQGEVPPPVGEATFLLADIENATPLWGNPGEMQTATSAWRRIVRETITICGGYLFRENCEEGVYAAAFSQSSAACRAALELQRCAVTHSWPAVLGSWTPRIALHSGIAPRVGEDYAGIALLQARCLLAACHRAQILLGEGVREAALDAPEIWCWKKLGTHRLRDLTAPMALCQLAQPGLRMDFDPPRTLDARKNNLPVQGSALIGRESDMNLLLSLLREGRRRLVTITGTGGVGKTRLALQAAADCTDLFPDGTWFISFADTPTGGMDTAIKDVLRRHRVVDDETEKEHLAQLLREKRCLLVLDNLETCVEEASLIGDILRAAPGVFCLVTSRVLLGLQDEQRVEVPPLTLPSESDDAERISLLPSAQLFVERAKTAHADFAPSREDWGIIGAICRRVDGLPLAVELAAAHARTLSLAEIERRMRRDFDALTSRLRDVPPRQRGVRATLLWSYNLLDEAQKRLLPRLVVFPGGFDSEAVCAINDGKAETYDLLLSLEESSLVNCRVENGVARYRLLSLIREFAREGLSPSALAGVQAHFCRHFLSEAQRLGGAEQPDEVLSFHRLQADMENLRAVYTLLQTKSSVELPSYVLSLSDFLRRRGYWRELNEWLPAAILMADRQEAEPAIRARLRVRLGHLKTRRREMGEALILLADAVKMARVLGEPRLLSEALNMQGLAVRREGRIEEAIALHRESQELAQTANFTRGVVSALQNSSLASLSQNDMATAHAGFTQAGEIARREGDLRGWASALNNLAHIADLQQQYSLSNQYSIEALEIARMLSEPALLTTPLGNIGDVLQKTGHIEAAAPFLVAAETIYGRMEDGNIQAATEYLQKIEAVYGRDRLDALRRAYSCLELSDLIHVDRLTRPPDALTL